MKRSIILLSLTLMGTSGFQFMSKFKISPPVDLAKEQARKEKFGDKSKSILSLIHYFHPSWLKYKKDFQQIRAKKCAIDGMICL